MLTRLLFSIYLPIFSISNIRFASVATRQQATGRAGTNLLNRLRRIRFGWRRFISNTPHFSSPFVRRNVWNRRYFKYTTLFVISLSATFARTRYTPEPTEASGFHRHAPEAFVGATLASPAVEAGLDPTLPFAGISATTRPFISNISMREGTRPSPTEIFTAELNGFG